MQSPYHHPPYHRLTEFVPLSAEEMSVASRWLTDRRRLWRGKAIRHEGEAVNGVFFLLEGWVGSSLLLRDGRRQIAKVHLPGDMLGFPSLALSHAGETLEALTDVTVCSLPNAAIGRIFEELPRLALGLFLSTQRERVALMQKLSWVGATSAIERLSAFLLDLHHRLEAAGLTESGSFDLPITQQQLGELLGLSTVHINRTFKSLDETGFIARCRGRLKIDDFEGLRRLAATSPPEFAGTAAWTRLRGSETFRKGTQ
ncbi:Crp/Fnr family transcriptional regulator [Novosphingobium sp. ZW T3_23]|uniref:Crp/Fnr family transcriptional regulator n=1 Tax=Novosphingobium sp. ZW T3_23 TaxID=3378084 RepID=UPI003853DCB3